MRPEDQHDPGGKVRIGLDLLTTGSAEFSPCGVFRTRLDRIWGKPDGRAVLFVGMNPSTADASVNDPTIHRECAFARLWGFDLLVKVNWLSRRATYPSDLLAKDIQITSRDNIEVIEQEARTASRVVLAHGVPHKSLEPYLLEAIAAIRRGVAGGPAKVFVLDQSKEGFPRHSLYIERTTRPRPFDVGAFEEFLKARISLRRSSSTATRLMDVQLPLCRSANGQ